MIGDFNEILSNSEKRGGPLRVESSFLPFRNLLATCDMYEVGSSGNGFTWGGTRNNQWIQCKLDRCFGNPAWFSMFPTAHQWFLEKLGSDDQPVLVEFTQDKSFFKEQFRFDKRWAEDPSFLHMLTKAWNHDSPISSSSFNIRAEHCRQAILDWKTHFWSNSARRIRSIRKALQVQDESPSPCFSRIRHLKSELAIAFREEEIYWRQRSTEKWLHDGDKNTGVFHACVNSTRSANTLHSLIDNSGVDQFSEKEKGEVAVQFFTDLFKSSVPLI